MLIGCPSCQYFWPIVPHVPSFFGIQGAHFCHLLPIILATLLLYFSLHPSYRLHVLYDISSDQGGEMLPLPFEPLSKLEDVLSPLPVRILS